MTSCPRPSAFHAAEAEARQNALTKPQGALGALERLVIRLAALQQQAQPSADHVHIALFAADHGITAQGVSAYPSAVTVQMLHNFAQGGAAISVLARELGAPLSVIDVGTLAEDDILGVLTDKTCRGTRDFSQEPAMTAEALQHALAAGRAAAHRAVQDNADFLILGEMGIGNTTSAAALAAALIKAPPSALVGAGTGLDAQGVAHKAAVISRALVLHDLHETDADARDVLRKLGGLEIAALCGAIIAAAQNRLPVLVDGFIVTVAALAAVRLNASCQDWLIYSHRSSEQGHRIVLEALGTDPLLDLKLRLGEGSGAALALPIIRLACALHAQMATFAEAQVSEAR